MNSLHIYLVISTLFALFMFTIWSRNSLLNFAIKFMILIIAVFGILEILHQHIFG